MQQLVSEAISQRQAADPAALPEQVTRYHSAAMIGASQTAARRGKLMRKHNALARRLLDRQDDYLRFTRDFRAPPDNNGTERDIRMAKLKQKVSGCLRTMTGARQYGLSFFDALVMLAEGQPWMPYPAWSSPANAGSMKGPDQLRRFKAFSEFIIHHRAARGALQFYYSQPEGRRSLSDISNVLRSARDSEAMTFLVLETERTYKACRGVLRALEQAQNVVYETAGKPRALFKSP